MSKVLRTSYWVIALSTVGSLAGCANYEINTGRGNIPGHYIRSEMQEADRTVEAARLAGKDKQCPEEFKAAEDAKDKAYDTFRACFTEEGAAQAKAATAKAKALCPPAKLAPAPVVPAPAPPVPAAPQDKLTITPGSLTKGEAATMTWSSTNASNCTIEPGFGPVPTQGTMTITPSDDTNYVLTCSGEGGAANSTAAVAVKAPAPVAAPAPAPVVVPPPPAPAPAVNYCKPMVMDVQFDTNKYDVKPQYKDELKMLADFLKEFPEAKGIIEGHTDSVGDKGSNMKLSQKRADSVRSYLVDNFGIAPDRIVAKGYGPTKPIADNKTKQGKAKNRRIEANFTCK